VTQPSASPSSLQTHDLSHDRGGPCSDTSPITAKQSTSYFSNFRAAEHHTYDSAENSEEPAKSIEMPFHQPFASKTVFSRSSPIKANQGKSRNPLNPHAHHSSSRHSKATADLSRHSEATAESLHDAISPLARLIAEGSRHIIASWTP
jgi:hypothetical protein